MLQLNSFRCLQVKSYFNLHVRGCVQIYNIDVFYFSLNFFIFRMPSTSFPVCSTMSKPLSLPIMCTTKSQQSIAVLVCSVLKANRVGTKRSLERRLTYIISVRQWDFCKNRSNHFLLQNSVHC